MKRQSSPSRVGPILAALLTMAVVACRPAVVSSGSKGGRNRQLTPQRTQWQATPAAQDDHHAAAGATHPARDRSAVAVVPPDQYLATARRVTQHRSWPSFPPVPVLKVDRTTLVDWLDQEQQAEIPRRSRVQLAQMMTLLGLVDPGFDWDDSLLRMVVDNLAGAYLTTRGAIVVRADLPASAWGETLFHEVVHSIQDRLYGLGGKTRYAPDRGDIIAAVHTLAEGEALSLELDEQLGSVGASLSADVAGELSSRLDEALGKQPGLPRIVQHSLAAPYVDGLMAVSELRRLDGWRAVEQMWMRGPQSTHGLLHPRPAGSEGTSPSGGGASSVWIAAPTLLFQQQEGILTDVMGEQGLRVVLEQALPRVTAAEVAEAWRGDRVAVGEEDGVWRVGWQIRGCGASASSQLADHLASALGLAGAGPEELAQSAALCTQDADGRGRTLVVDNCDIVVVAEWRDGSGSEEARHSFCERGERWARSVTKDNRVQCPRYCSE